MKIDLSHGNGGVETARLISEFFIPALGNPFLAAGEDAAVLSPGPGLLAFTTDSFVVKPLIFPGGDIGRLAVCGAVNDLLSMGATPQYLALGFILETNFDTDYLPIIINSIQETAREAHVTVAAADTKVIEGDGGMLISASGIGFIEHEAVRPTQIKTRDQILISGFLGEHHACILSQRMGIENHIQSDAAPLTDMCQKLQAARIPIHAMRDVTRGGLATILHELAEASGLTMVVEEEKIPVSREVQGMCALLGLDPLLMGNEGKLAVFVPQPYAERAVSIIRNARYGQNAAIIGSVSESNTQSRVIMKTRLGGRRFLSPLRGEGLPRIC